MVLGHFPLPSFLRQPYPSGFLGHSPTVYASMTKNAATPRSGRCLSWKARTCNFRVVTARRVGQTVAETNMLLDRSIGIGMVRHLPCLNIIGRRLARSWYKSISGQATLFSGSAGQCMTRQWCTPISGQTIP